MMHAGKPLCSHGNPRPCDKAFHGKPLHICSRRRGLYSYTPKQISSSLIRYTKQLSNLDPKRKSMQTRTQGLQRWKILESRETYRHLSTEEQLHQYSECLDDLFFGGLLKGFYKIRFLDDAKLLKVKYGSCSAHMYSSFPYGHGYELHIDILNRTHSHSFQRLDRPSQLKSYLGTLVHEMVHAVFALYSCYDCSPCVTRFTDEVGTSGHGMLWQKLAMSIEHALNHHPDLMNGWTYDLGRSRSFVLEYNGNPSFPANKTLQNSLTIRQLGELKLDSSTTWQIRGLLQTRDTQRTVYRKRGPTAKFGSRIKTGALRKKGPGSVGSNSSGSRR